MSSSNGKTFQESWAYASELKTEIGAVSYDIQQYPGKFASGRDQLMACFSDSSRRVIARRIGMELTSKRTGKPYQVFSREEWIERPERAVRLDSGDAFESA
jgi:peroxiredoxin